MKKFYLLLISLTFITPVFSQTWTSVSTDPSGDGASAGLLDGTEFSYWYDSVADSLWFRINTANLNSTNAQAVGVNIMVNAAGAGSTFNFWGSSNMDPYHFLLTAWVTGTPPSSYTGTIGLANAMGVNSMNYTNLSSNNLDIIVDVANNRIDIGLERTDIVPDLVFSGSSITVKAAAAVGSDQFWNDDIYDPNGQITLTKSSVSLNEEATTSLSVFPNPSSDIVYIENYHSGNYSILSMSGQSVASGKISAAGTIDISGLNTGLYFLQMDSQFIKFVRQ